MSKFNRVLSLILALLLSCFLCLSLTSTSAFAEKDDNKEVSDSSGTDISVIDKNVGFNVSDTGEVTMTGVDSDVSSGMAALLNFIKLLSAVGTIVMLMVFVINFIKLGTSGTNANARAGAITALVWSGIATACLSMSTVIFFFFFKINHKIVDDKNSSQDGEDKKEEKK